MDATTKKLKTVIGFYEDIDAAGRIGAGLKRHGLSRESLYLASREEAPTDAANHPTGATATPVINPIMERLTGWGVPRDEARFFAEGVHRGGSLVAVRLPEELAMIAARYMSGDESAVSPPGTELGSEDAAHGTTRRGSSVFSMDHHG